MPRLGRSSAKHTRSTDILPITQALGDTTEMASDIERGIYLHRVYYLSGRDGPRLYVPNDLRLKILEQCHEKLGRMGGLINPVN